VGHPADLESMIPRSVDGQLALLEADVFDFRTGYLRERVARRLAQAPLDAGQRARARAIVLGVVDGRLHTPIAGISRLGRAVADNRLRRELRDRLHAANDRVARMALHVVVEVPHPGYTTNDLDAARAVLLREVGLWPGQGFSSPRHVRIAFKLLTPEWEQELRDMTQVHGPDRGNAKSLLRLIGRRRERRAKRPGP
jgi:hypothetical protein